MMHKECLQDILDIFVHTLLSSKISSVVAPQHMDQLYFVALLWGLLQLSALGRHTCCMRTNKFPRLSTRRHFPMERTAMLIQDLDGSTGVFHLPQVKVFVPVRSWFHLPLEFAANLTAIFYTWHDDVRRNRMGFRQCHKQQKHSANTSTHIWKKELNIHFVPEHMCIYARVRLKQMNYTHLTARTLWQCMCTCLDVSLRILTQRTETPIYHMNSYEIHDHAQMQTHLPPHRSALAFDGSIRPHRKSCSCLA